ncbi:helix-turn-helix domain-containing protein [Pseudoalteromonas luteoviolacea]|uniref:helix-turn-helix domain-containing protein n=1 Tax=Pseudoalteromonas luteoviolacea TaxID=43657 RepID=UPI001B38B302|nr:helix-turn-helix domain-containing protein [Pseudoalteromonas luteoviolacea]MBQ4836064.1 helix-turn-helix domain-containing protein [Pseudoalteromonas luteoviolacea]
MSRAATDWAWKQSLGSSSLKLLLLAFADRADEDFCCFPSISRLVKDTDLNQKTVGSNIKKLEALGVIEDTGKRKGSTGKVKIYRLIGVEEGVKINTPKSGGISQKHPSQAHKNQAPQEGVEANTPKNGVTSNSNTSKNGSLNTSKNGSLNTPKNGSQNQSLEPPIEPNKNKTKKSLDYSCWPSMPTPQVLDDWLAMRKRKRANVTQTVINRFAKELKIAAEHGVSVDDCLSECVFRNWQGFEFEWMNRNARLNQVRQVQSRPLTQDFSQNVEGW